MIDFFENVGLLVALCMSGAGVVTIVVVMVLKFLDTVEDRRRD